MHQRSSLFFILSLSLGVFACDDDDDDAPTETTDAASPSPQKDSGPPPGKVDSGPAPSKDSGSTPSEAGPGQSSPDGGDASAEVQDIAIDFRAMVGDSAAECGETYSLGTPGTDVGLLDLRLYISGVHLLNSDGDKVPLKLVQDSPFVFQDITLLDFEDGTAGCSATGNTPTNSKIVGTVPVGEYSGLVFTLGVPAELNHQSVDDAESPLNIRNMFWNWLPGYKFARIDVKPVAGQDGGTPAPWNFHLGSTMCMQNLKDGGAPNPKAPPDMDCARPNRPTYELSSFEPGKDDVVIDIGELFSGSDVSTNLGGETPGCMSFPPDAKDCAAVFPQAGLSYETGECEKDCQDQALFRVDEAAKE